ncbi:hypothetical protein CRYUN_Cryun17cG0005300 [Craigia yunnanensis]
MEMNHHPEKSSSFNKGDNNDNNSSADNTLPAMESPKCSNEEKSAAAKITEVEMEKTEEMKTGQTEIEEIEKPEEKEEEEGGELGEPTPPPEIEYTLEIVGRNIVKSHERNISRYYYSPSRINLCRKYQTEPDK